MDNEPLKLAWQFVEFTGVNLFLTGKAGTGKTTFLKKIKESISKRMVVLAPTGVAAINAGGVTIHSFFQLPFAPFVPGTDFSKDIKFSAKFSKEKRQIIRSLELIIIDEISMVRADLLDAVDVVLRHFRRNNSPFGGIQLLMIGDLQQLAPVVRDEDWELLKEQYDSVYFFSSKALQQTSYISVELKHIYRQTDQVFISILNKIRDNKLDRDALEILNKRFVSGFNPQKEDGYIILTTHNHQAQQINERNMISLDEKSYFYQAQIEGNFPTYSYPTEEVLELKKGSQVMFVKNDSSADKRYYNGRLGIITEIDEDCIKVRCEGDADDILVNQENWSNTRYSLNKETKEIEEIVDGTFKQYPLKAAWAITVHKSQGLTFEKAFLDVNAAFAPGQVYVALSRCKTLEGLVLSSPLRPKAVINSELVNQYTRYIEENQPDEMQLHFYEREYYLKTICELFDYSSIQESFNALFWHLNDHYRKQYPSLFERYQDTYKKIPILLSQVGERFQIQLHKMVFSMVDYEENPSLKERIQKGVSYFYENQEQLFTALLQDTAVETDNVEVEKKFNLLSEHLIQELHIKEAVLRATHKGFDLSSYMKVKALAMMDKTPRVLKKKGKDLPKDILNPDLYEVLRAWRSSVSREAGVPAYVVLQQTALIGITNICPRTGKDLLEIPGVGKKTVEKYGSEILDIVISNTSFM